jgi:hypothetical protein
MRSGARRCVGLLIKGKIIMEGLIAGRATAAVPEPKEATPYCDERFSVIDNNATQLNGLLNELNGMFDRKLGALLGISPNPPCNPLDQTGNSWADRIIMEQDASIMTCREILEKMSRV